MELVDAAGLREWWSNPRDNGSLDFGVARVKWRRWFPSIWGKTFAGFDVSVEGQSAHAEVVTEFSPYELRRGVTVLLDGQECQLRRNGPRPLRRMRSIAVECGSDLRVEGRVESGMRKIRAGDRLLWTGRGTLRSPDPGWVASDLSAQECALVLVIIATDALATTSLFNVLNGLWFP